MSTLLRQRATSPNCQSSTQRTSRESCKSFGLTPSPTNSYSPAAIKTAWRPSSCEGDGDGLGTSWGESRTTSLAQPFTGHLKESARGEYQETPGAELWRQSSRPCNTLGYHPEAGPAPTDVAILRSRPKCHTANWAWISEWVLPENIRNINNNSFQKESRPLCWKLFLNGSKHIFLLVHEAHVNIFFATQLNICPPLLLYICYHCILRQHSLV